MKWLLTFVAGALLGAGALFFFLWKIGGETPPALIAASAGAPPAPAAPDPMGALPGAPVVPTDLTEADLPLRPAPHEFPIVDPLAAGSVPHPGGKLLVPVEGMQASALRDTFDQPRGRERHHEALDIMAPKGAKVLAVADGKLVKLFNSKPGGLTIYQFDQSEKFAYYYAHLDRYAEGVKEGMPLKRGDLIGYVGASGNADPAAPHLHFAVVELTAEKQWWKGSPLNPYPLLAN